MRRLRRNNPTYGNKNNDKSKFDVWLSRASYFSQVGLLAAAIFGYFYTVLPLYQKAVLDEEIAKKELELKATKTALEESYTQLRRYVVAGFIISAMGECTGALIPYHPPSKAGEKSKEAARLHNEILDIGVSHCLHENFSNTKQLSKLRRDDFTYLAQQVDALGAELEKMREIALIDFHALPTKAASNPEILAPLDANSFVSRSLEILRPYMSPKSYQSQVYEAQIDQALSKIAYQYAENVRDKISGLSNLGWQKRTQQ